MVNYCKESEIENVLGFTVSSITRPDSDQLAQMLIDADGLINGVLNTSSNVTDSTGTLKQIAIDLTLKMIRRMWSFSNPDEFEYAPVILEPEQRRMILRVGNAVFGKTWDLGG